MLAHDGLEDRIRGIGPAAVGAIDANPVHLASAPDFICADDRHVVLRLAGHDARGAAGAGAEVDRQSPSVSGGRMLGPERWIAGMRQVPAVRRVSGAIVEEGRQRDLTHERSAFHGVVSLRRGQRRSSTGPLDLDDAGEGATHAIGLDRHQPKRIDADVLPNATGTLTSISQRD